MADSSDQDRLAIDPMLSLEQQANLSPVQIYSLERYKGLILLSWVDIVLQKYSSILSKGVRVASWSSSSRMTQVPSTSPKDSRKATPFIGNSTRLSIRGVIILND